MNINFKKQSGFNLIEVMLAFLILSIGLLGVAGLQTTAVKSSHTAMLRTIAITKVHSMIERMLANNAVTLSAYAQTKDGALTIGVDNDCADLPPVSCAPAALAENDIFSWGQSLINAGLPSTGTQAAIVVEDGILLAGVPVPPIATVSVYWQERGEEMYYETVIQK